MSLLAASAKHYIVNDRFLVAIDGFKSDAFFAVGPVDTDARRITPRECVISRAKVEGDDDLLLWAKSGESRSVVVRCVDVECEEIGRIHIAVARPLNYSTGPWIAKERDVLMESVTFEYDASRATATYRSAKAGDSETKPSAGTTLPEPRETWTDRI